MEDWTSSDVAHWVRSFDALKDFADVFEARLIDGPKLIALAAPPPRGAGDVRAVAALEGA